MINKKVDDAIFEVILTHAFREAFAQEMEQIEAEDDQAAKPSEKYRKQEQRYYKKMQRKPIKAMSIVRTTAACVAAIICLSSGAMMFSPPVRAAVVDTVVGFFEKYVTVEVDKGGESVAIGAYALAYVPRGFELIDTTESAIVNRYKFSNGFEFFRICIYDSKESLLKYDNEYGTTTKMQINGEDAYFMQNENGYYTILWYLNDKTFSIDGNIASNTLKKIAEKIS